MAGPGFIVDLLAARSESMRSSRTESVALRSMGRREGLVQVIRVMDYDEACCMHLTPGVVHNFPKAVGV